MHVISSVITVSFCYQSNNGFRVFQYRRTAGFSLSMTFMPSLLTDVCSNKILRWCQNHRQPIKISVALATV